MSIGDSLRAVRTLLTIGALIGLTGYANAQTLVEYSGEARFQGTGAGDEGLITRAMSGQINWIQAAEILGMSDRQLRRWRQRWEAHGYDGLFDRRTQRPSPKRVPVAEVEQVLRLYRERYFDFNVKHFVEKLHEEHQIELSYTWVKTALQTAWLVQNGGGTARRGPGGRAGDAVTH